MGSVRSSLEKADRPPHPTLSREHDAQSMGKPGTPFIAVHVEASFFLGCMNCCLRSHPRSLTLWNDETVTGKWSSFCTLFDDRWLKGGWLLYCLPSPVQHGEWWKQPSALTTWAPCTIYIPENKPSALFSIRKYLKFIEKNFVFLNMLRFKQFEAWPGSCSIILSLTRWQHGQQSVTAWTSSSFQFLHHCFLLESPKYATEQDQSLSSDTSDPLGNWIKITNLKAYPVP